MSAPQIYLGNIEITEFLQKSEELITKINTNLKYHWYCPKKIIQGFIDKENSKNERLLDRQPLIYFDSPAVKFTFDVVQNKISVTKLFICLREIDETTFQNANQDLIKAISETEEIINK